MARNLLLAAFAMLIVLSFNQANAKDSKADAVRTPASDGGQIANKTNPGEFFCDYIGTRPNNRDVTYPEGGTLPWLAAHIKYNCDFNKPFSTGVDSARNNQVYYCCTHK